jgi:hypothetical protein
VYDALSSNPSSPTQAVDASAVGEGIVLPYTQHYLVTAFTAARRSIW